MKRLLLFYLLFIPVISIFAQHYTFKNYNASSGLPSSEVYEIYQDKKGFVWFATDNGISKFDGQEFKNFHVKEGLTDPVVFGFQEDEEGRVWLRTYSGKLSFIENDKFSPYKYNEKLFPLIKHGLLAFEYNVKEKSLSFRVRNSIGMVDSTGHITTDTLDVFPDAVTLKYLNKKPYLILTNTTPFINKINIEGKNYEFEQLTSEFANKVLRTIYWKGKLYLSLYNGLLEFDGKNVKKIFESTAPIISLTLDNQERLWVGYLNGGAERFSDTTFSKKWTLDVIKNKSVSYVKETRDGTLWVSTVENGVYVFPNLSVEHIDLPENVKLKAVAGGNEYVILGDKSGTVRIYDVLKREVTSKPIPMGFELHAIFNDRKKNYWISGFQGITVFNEHLEKTKIFEGLSFIDMYQKRDGSYVALASQRIFEFSNSLLKTKETRQHDIQRQITAHNNKIFLASRIGLYTCDSNFENRKPVDGFQNFKISELLSINDSLLFVATIGNGFFVINTKSSTTKQYDGNNFLANNIHAGIIKNNVLWLGTENGLVNIPITSLIADNPMFNYLNKNSGLDSDIVYFLAPTSNEIWAFSENDFSIIPDTLTRFASTKPDFYIKEIKCNNEILTQDDLLQLKPEQNNLQIHFGFILFNNSHIQLRYKLNERSPWIVTDNHLLQLSSLAPGTYKFLLQYSPDNYYWYDASIPISFTINPPWYKRWYIYPFAFLIVIIFSYLYIRNRQKIFDEKNNFLKIINEHQEKLIQSEIATRERERNRIAKELHDGVGTNLTAIKLSVHQILQHYNDPMTKDIEDQFQVAITEIKNIIYDLTPPSLERYGLFTAIKNYVSKIKKNIPINIDIQSFGHEVNNFDLNITVFRILQELISNSIKHSKAKNITIHLSTFEDLLSIIYEDDGIGFKYDPIFNGLGLDNIESRIRSLHGTLKFDSGEFGVSYNIDIPISKTIKKDNV